jgi:hypothetical protein
LSLGGNKAKEVAGGKECESLLTHIPLIVI